MRRAFTMIELMIVVAIIAFLAVIAYPKYLTFMARAKRSEAYLTLASLYAAQKAYWAEHSAYCALLQGANSLNWKPEGKTHYTYGFAGAVGVNYIPGKLVADLGALAQGHADQQGFVAVAVGDIDGDGKSDVLTINDKNEIALVQDDLQ